jgi:hypothetical protein
MGSRGSRYLRGSVNGAAGLTTRYILREGAHGQPALAMAPVNNAIQVLHLKLPMPVVLLKFRTESFE